MKFAQPHRFSIKVRSSSSPSIMDRDLKRFGGAPDDPWAEEWYGLNAITPVVDGVRLMLSWGVMVEIADPIAPIVLLPVPHPSGKGVL